MTIRCKLGETDGFVDELMTALATRSELNQLAIVDPVRMGVSDTDQPVNSGLFERIEAPVPHLVELDLSECAPTDDELLSLQRAIELNRFPDLKRIKVDLDTLERAANGLGEKSLIFEYLRSVKVYTGRAWTDEEVLHQPYRKTRKPGN